MTAERAFVGSKRLLGRSVDGTYGCAYATAVAEFEWDEAKAAANARKHGIDFADAATALSDEMAITIPDATADGEQRFVTLAVDALGRILVVAYTWRGERIRLISARPATRRERLAYEGKRR
jgi:uncharacterized protein